ncbi:MAG: glyoxylate reductase [Candidatus Caldarchaeales archaeon]
MRPLVYVTRRIPEVGLSILREYCEVVYRDELAPPSKEELLNNIKDVDAIFCTLNEKIDKQVLDSSPKLRVVGTMSVGVDHIDIDYATSKGVYIIHTPGVLTETTADLAFALILSVARRVVESDRIVREGKWKIAWAPTMMLGYDVHGKKLGIIGLGRIGAAVAKRAKGFGMEIYYYDKIRREDLERDMGIVFKNLDDILRESDFISIHVPLTEETRYLIGERELKMMKPTAILINTSRGPVVNEKALVKALREGWIAGAGLDVFEEEPLPYNSPLIELPNVVLTPHIGSATIDTRNKMAAYAADGIIRVLRGELPDNLYNKEVVKIRPPVKLID